MNNKPKADITVNIRYIFHVLRRQDAGVIMLLIGCVISATVLPLWEISIPQRMLSLLLDNARRMQCWCA